MFSYTVNINNWNIEPIAMPTEQPKPKKERAPKSRKYPEPSLYDAFLAKYPDWAFIANEYKEATGFKLAWQTLNRSNLVKFVQYLKGKFAPNTVNQYAIRLKAVLNIYSEEVKLPNNYNEILTPRKVASTAIFLNEDELKRMEEYEPQSEYERLVKYLFLCSAYTGARYVDIIRMNSSNIRDNELVFVAQKTKKELRLPLKPIVAEYIRKMPKLEITKAGYIKIVRRICQNMGMTEPVKILKAGKEEEMPKWRAIGSHTARRSFITNLYLRGVDIYTLSKMAQHSAIRLTEKYICVDIKPLDDKAKEFFS